MVLQVLCLVGLLAAMCASGAAGARYWLGAVTRDDAEYFAGADGGHTLDVQVRDGVLPCAHVFTRTAV